MYLFTSQIILPSSCLRSSFSLSFFFFCRIINNSGRPYLVMIFLKYIKHCVRSRRISLREILKSHIFLFLFFSSFISNQTASFTNIREIGHTYTYTYTIGKDERCIIRWKSNYSRYKIVYFVNEFGSTNNKIVPSRYSLLRNKDLLVERENMENYLVI